MQSDSRSALLSGITHRDEEMGRMTLQILPGRVVYSDTHLVIKQSNNRHDEFQKVTASDCGFELIPPFLLSGFASSFSDLYHITAESVLGVQT